MSKKPTKKRAPKKSTVTRKKPYLTAAKLDILPAERTALIAFVKSRTLDDSKVILNGHAHYYSQCYVEDKYEAANKECGTAGCIAGYVFAHINIVQGKRCVRNRVDADGYIGAAVYGSSSTVLHDLYRRGESTALVTARKVVDHALRAGKVDWSPAKEG